MSPFSRLFSHASTLDQRFFVCASPCPSGIFSLKHQTLPQRRAYNAGWYFDFTIAYIGAGFITPLAVNVSMMIGAVLSWGIAWPLIANRAGDWYPAEFLEGHSFRGAFACASSYTLKLWEPLVCLPWCHPLVRHCLSVILSSSCSALLYSSSRTRQLTVGCTPVLGEAADGMLSPLRHVVR